MRESARPSGSGLSGGWRRVPVARAPDARCRWAHDAATRKRNRRGTCPAAAFARIAGSPRSHLVCSSAEHATFTETNLLGHLPHQRLDGARVGRHGHGCPRQSGPSRQRLLPALAPSCSIRGRGRLVGRRALKPFDVKRSTVWLAYGPPLAESVEAANGQSLSAQHDGGRARHGAR